MARSKKKSPKVGTNKNRHKAQCTICKSPDRKNIEKDYRSGLSLREIALEYPDISPMAMCRHIQAFPKLREKRSPEAILDRIIEHGAIGKMKIDGHLLLKSLQTKLKLQGKLTDGGRKPGEEKTGFPPITINAQTINIIEHDNLQEGMEKFGIKIPAKRFSDN